MRSISTKFWWGFDQFVWVQPVQGGEFAEARCALELHNMCHISPIEFISVCALPCGHGVRMDIALPEVAFPSE